MATNELKARSSRGATRKASKPMFRVRGVNFKALLWVVCLLVLPLAAVKLWPLVGVSIDRPVGRVLVEGDFYFVDQVRVADLVMAELAAQGVGCLGCWSSLSLSLWHI